MMLSTSDIDKSRNPSPRIIGRRFMSPKKKRSENKQQSQQPIYAKSLQTMGGGFEDLRPDDSEDSESEDDRLDKMIREQTYKFNSDRADYMNNSSNRYVKIPRKLLTNMMENVSPRLAKKLDKANTHSKLPIWPVSMNTYSRGVSIEKSEMRIPTEPSLSALRVQAHLHEQKELRLALRELLNDVVVKPDNYLSDSDSENDSDDEFYKDSPVNTKKINKKFKKVSSIETDVSSDSDIMNFDGVSMDSQNSNPDCDILIKIEEPSPEPMQPNDFFEEDLNTAFGTLSLSSVPTLNPEKLSHASINDVRNVHVTSNYIVLETTVSDDLIFV